MTHWTKKFWAKKIFIQKIFVSKILIISEERISRSWEIEKKKEKKEKREEKKEEKKGKKHTWYFTGKSWTGRFGLVLRRSGSRPAPELLLTRLSMKTAGTGGVLDPDRVPAGDTRPCCRPPIPTPPLTELKLPCREFCGCAWGAVWLLCSERAVSDMAELRPLFG